MPHSRFIDANGILITTLSGAITLNELIELEDELRSYKSDESIYELVLHSEDIKVALGSNESISSARTLQSVVKGIRKGAIAFVSDKEYIFGLCRQLEMRVDNELIQIRVFRTEENARKWLYKMQSLNKVDTVDG